MTVEKGNAVLLGDETLNFQRPTGDVQPSQVIEGAALPDKAARFFGRGRELIQLADIFASADLRGAALTGIGGIGKSALAFEAADRLAWRFDDRVAYVEASEVGFKAGDALNELARGLGLTDTTNPGTELRDFVNRQPCLLLFDNMERAGSELYRLADFVSSLNLDAGTQVLFTLRPPLSDRFQDIREVPLVRGLDERAALDFVRTTAYNLHAAPEWQQPAEAHALVDRVQGHPELMRLTIYRSLKTPFARVKRELAELSGKLDEALQDLIGKQVSDAGEMAQCALACLTIFPQPRMIAEVAVAACGDDADGLEALTEHGVIALEQDDVQRYVLHPTAIDWIKSRPVRRDHDLDVARYRSMLAYNIWAQANHVSLLRSEEDNLIAVWDWIWRSWERLNSNEKVGQVLSFIEILEDLFRTELQLRTTVLQFKNDTIGHLIIKTNLEIKLEIKTNVLKRSSLGMQLLLIGSSLCIESLEKVASGKFDKTTIDSKLSHAALYLQKGITILEPMNDRRKYVAGAQDYLATIEEIRSKYIMTRRQ